MRVVAKNLASNGVFKGRDFYFTGLVRAYT